MLLARLFGDLASQVQTFVRDHMAGAEQLPPEVLALIPALHRLAATTPRLLFWVNGPAQAVPGLPASLVKWQWMVLPASAVLHTLYELVEHQGALHTERGEEEANTQLYNSIMPTLAAFGQALLLVAPRLTAEQLQSTERDAILLVPYASSASLVMGHHSPTRLLSHLGPALHAALEQLAAAPPESATPLALSVLRTAAGSKEVFG
jgi:hypothetical protein